MRPSYVCALIGPLLIYFGVSFLPVLAVAFYYGEYGALMPFGLTGLLTVLTGYSLYRFSNKQKNLSLLKKREALFVAVITWLSVSFIGSIPYMFYDLSPIDALFESTACITTCGATIISDLTGSPRSIIFWRSMSQWIGGLGIVVIFLAVLPSFSAAGNQIFPTENSGPKDASHTPKLKDSASGLWKTYLLLTCLGFLALWAAGMPAFDAICNSFSSISAGGLSPNPQSIMGYRNDIINIIIIFIMLMSGINFTLQYGLWFSGRVRSLIYNSEFRWYIGIIIFFSLALTFILLGGSGYSSVGRALLDSFYQVISVITSTGSFSVDYDSWSYQAKLILLIIMLIGGSSGSAAGGIKIIRVIYLYKYLKNEVYFAMHPQAVQPVKIDNTPVSETTGRQIIGFILLYLMLFVSVALLTTVLENDLMTGISGTAATIGNVGLGFGPLGPFSDFSHLRVSTKIIFMITMIMGRLEILPVLLFFRKDFWERHRPRAGD